MAAIENADRKFQGASLVDPDELDAVIEEVKNSSSAGGGHGGGPPGGHRGPPGGGRGGPPGGRRGPPDGGGPGGFHPIELFETQDADEDGKLVGDEIPDHMRERLEFVDTDGNGEVSREEIEAMSERFRRGPPGGGPGGGRRGPPGGGHGQDDAGGQSDRPQRPE